MTQVLFDVKFTKRVSSMKRCELFCAIYLEKKGRDLAPAIASGDFFIRGASREQAEKAKSFFHRQGIEVNLIERSNSREGVEPKFSPTEPNSNIAIKQKNKHTAEKVQLDEAKKANYVHILDQKVEVEGLNGRLGSPYTNYDLVAVKEFETKTYYGSSDPILDAMRSSTRHVGTKQESTNRRREIKVFSESGTSFIFASPFGRIFDRAPSPGTPVKMLCCKSKEGEYISLEPLLFLTTDGKYYGFSRNVEKWVNSGDSIWLRLTAKVLFFMLLINFISFPIKISEEGKTSIFFLLGDNPIRLPPSELWPILSLFVGILVYTIFNYLALRKLSNFFGLRLGFWRKVAMQTLIKECSGKNFYYVRHYPVLEWVNLLLILLFLFVVLQIFLPAWMGLEMAEEIHVGLSQLRDAINGTLR